MLKRERSLPCMEHDWSKEPAIIFFFFSGEDNCVLQWNLLSGVPQPEASTFHLPSTVPSQGLLLPTLIQSVRFMRERERVEEVYYWILILQSQQNCVASAVDQVICVWKVKDGKSVIHRFPELVMALEFKPSQPDGELVVEQFLSSKTLVFADNLPLILVGLVDGSLSLVEVAKASFKLTPQLQITDLEDPVSGSKARMK